MGVTVTKKAPVVKAKVEQEQSLQDAIAELVDRLEDVTHQITLVQPYLDEHEDIVKHLRSLTAAHDATKEVQFAGTHKQVVFSPCGQTRKIIDKEAMKKALTNKVFMQVATVTLGDIDKYTTEIQQKEFIKQAQDGPRKFSFIDKK